MTHSWASVLGERQRAKALAVAQQVIGRVADLDCREAAFAAAARQTRFPETLRWTSYSVSAGEAGLAIMCAYSDACFPGHGWDIAGHDLLATAACAVDEGSGIPVGLFGGVSGLAFASQLLSREGRRYRKFLAALDESLAPRVLRLGEGLCDVRESRSPADFDVISGASGVAAFLLHRDAYAMLPKVLAGLMALAEPSGGLPRWWTPPEFMDDGTGERMYPHGYLNCGLAHGIPGPLALLSLAVSVGHELPRQKEAVRTMADWVVAQRVVDQWGVNWPAVVPVTRDRTAQRACDGFAPSRPTWCYGSAGVARALWHAGGALRDAELQRLAVAAMQAVLQRPADQRHIDSPTLCHGVAGLLQVVLRFWHDTQLAVFSAAAAELVDQLLAAYDPARPLGFASIEPGRNPVDRAGLLDGAPGVAMSLLAAATDAEPTWDRMFLLS